MSPGENEEPIFEDPNEALRKIAQNPAASAQYLADYHRVVLDMQAKLEILQRETRVHCRKTRVGGDKWGQARLRSFPVEKSLNDLIKHLKSVASSLEKSAHKRHAHDEKVKEVAKQRKEKAQLKERQKTPPLQAAPQNPPQQSQQGAQSQSYGYGGPTSIYDIPSRESA